MTEEQSLNFHQCSHLNAPGVQYRCSVVEQEFQNSLCALDFNTTQNLVQINQFRETEPMCKKKIRIHTVQSTITKFFTPRN